MCARARATVVWVCVGPVQTDESRKKKKKDEDGVQHVQATEVQVCVNRKSFMCIKLLN